MNSLNKSAHVGLFAIPAALLILASGLGASPASAEPTHTLKPVTARVVYNPDAPPEAIFADIKRAARKACYVPGPRPLALREHDAQCAEAIMKAAVDRIGRADVASVYRRTPRG